MAKCDLAKFKQPDVTFCLLVKIVRPRQCLGLLLILLYISLPQGPAYMEIYHLKSISELNFLSLAALAYRPLMPRKRWKERLVDGNPTMGRRMSANLSIQTTYNQCQSLATRCFSSCPDSESTFHFRSVCVAGCVPSLFSTNIRGIDCVLRTDSSKFSITHQNSWVRVHAAPL